MWHLKRAFASEVDSLLRLQELEPAIEDLRRTIVAGFILFSRAAEQALRCYEVVLHLRRQVWKSPV
jgi:hypothetical protein